jgi:GntR family transcriptional regulator / MocR family aminotransferase
MLLPWVQFSGMPLATLNLVRVDRRQRAPLQTQLCRQIRELIISRQLDAGVRIPSTRDLANQLGVSRNTVVYALDQLVSEGYLNTRPGAGVFVTDLQREKVSAAKMSRAVAPRKSLNPSTLAVRLLTARTTPSYSSSKVRPFRPCQPALEHFPIRNWNRARSYALRSQSRELFGEGDPAGLPRLRRALSVYLRDARGVRCTADQIVITTGTQQALYLIASLLINRGQRVWIEDPGYLGARAAMIAVGADIVPVPIDNEGLTVARVRQKLPRLIYCTPSRQFPLGTTMSLARRLALLEFARKHDIWIIEDDYDSEFRYSDRPLPSLQGLTDDQSVIYAGSFSKVLFPSLRIGYLVLPESVVHFFRRSKEVHDGGSPALDQATAAVFIEEGFFATHVRRMRKLYRERLEIFLEEAKKRTSGWLNFSVIDAGMDATGMLKPGSDDAFISTKLSAAGIDVPAVSAYSLSANRPGLVFGFTAFSSSQIQSGMATVAGTIGL